MRTNIGNYTIYNFGTSNNEANQMVPVIEIESNSGPVESATVLIFLKSSHRGATVETSSGHYLLKTMPGERISRGAINAISSYMAANYPNIKRANI